MTMLISAIAQDHLAHLMIAHMGSIGLRTDGLLKSVSQHKTATCSMNLDGHGNLLNGVADMTIVQDMEVDQIIPRLQQASPKLVVLDANLKPETIAQIIETCISRGIPTFFEPTSRRKCTGLVTALKNLTSSDAHSIDYISPNVLELRDLSRGIQDEGLIQSDRWQNAVASFQLSEQFFTEFDDFISATSLDLAFLEEKEVIPLAINLLPFIKHVIVKCGAQGTVIVSKNATASFATPLRYLWKKGNISISICPPASVLTSDEVVNVTGAGDSFVGVLAAGLALNPASLQHPVVADKLVQAAQSASVYSLKSPKAVSDHISELQLERLIS